MKIHRRVAVAALAGVAVALSAAGCSNGSGSSPSASGGSGGKGGETITYWSMYEETEPIAAVMKDAIKKYEEDTGNTVKVEWQGRENTTKLQAALRTSDIPDVVDQAGGQIQGSLASTGQAADLSSVMTTKIPGEDKTPNDVGVDAYKDMDSTSDGTMFLAPYSPQAYGIFYDGSKNDFSDVKTWDQFTAALADQKAATGKGPIAIDGDVPGYTSIWTFSALIAELGQGKLLDLANDKTGEGWKSDDVKKAVTYIADLAKNGDFLDGSFGSKFPAVEQRFAQGESTFLYMGSWAPGELKTSLTSTFKMRTIPFPTMDAGKNFTQVDPLGFAIPKASKHIEAAKQFISYFYTKDFQNAIVNTVGNMSIRNDIAAPAGLEDLAKDLASGNVETYFDGVSQLADYNTTVFSPLNVDLMSGKLSVDDFVTKMAAAQKLYWEQKS